MRDVDHTFNNCRTATLLSCFALLDIMEPVVPHRTAVVFAVGIQRRLLLAVARSVSVTTLTHLGRFWTKWVLEL